MGKKTIAHIKTEGTKKFLKTDMPESFRLSALLIQQTCIEWLQNSTVLNMILNICKEFLQQQPQLVAAP